MEALSHGILAAAAPGATVDGNSGQGAIDGYGYGDGRNGIRPLAAAPASRPVP
jgi:hypothetical protein